MQINEKHVAPIWGDHSFLLDGLRTILRIRATWADPPLKKDAAEVADVPSDFVRNYSNKQLPNLDIVKPPAMPNRNKRIKDKQQAPNQKNNSQNILLLIQFYLVAHCFQHGARIRGISNPYETTSANKGSIHGVFFLKRDG